MAVISGRLVEACSLIPALSHPMGEGEQPEIHVDLLISW